MHIEHVAIWTTDLEQLKAFYTKDKISDNKCNASLIVFIELLAPTLDYG